MDGVPHRISFKGEDVVGVLRRIGERTLPQTLGINRLHPDPMITLIDRMLQREACPLERADVVAEIHQ